MTFTIRRLLLVMFVLAFVQSFLVLRLQAQYTSPPQTYSITQVNSMLPLIPAGVTMTQKIYRDGSKVLMEMSYPPMAEDPKGFHNRALRDLQAYQYWLWHPDETSSPCGAGTFSGDWGDPFDFSASMTADLPKQQPREMGMETVNGIATKVFEAKYPQGGGWKLWLDTKYGLIIKFDGIAKNGQHQTILEVKEFSLAKPPASVFALPPACASAPITGHSESTLGPGGQITSHATADIGVPGTSDETPGNAGDFVRASALEPSRNSCTVFFRVVRAGTMETFTSGFRIWLNDHEVTGQMRDGVLRIDNVPPEFNMGANFGNSGSAVATIQRQCFRPETVLLFVVKNPEKITDGADWLWVKAGKFATPPIPMPPASASQKGAPQNAPSQESASQLGVPSGTQVSAEYEDGTEVKLKPEEQVALIFLSDIRFMETNGCSRQLDRLCSMDELIKGVKVVGGTIGFNRNPDQDANYRYTITIISNDEYEAAAIPRRAGLSGFLKHFSNFFYTYYNPNGAATVKNQKLGGILIEGATFRRK